MEKVYGKHRPLTDEMLHDLSMMGDKEFSMKWNTSRQYPIRVRKRLGIKSFTPQHDLKPHRFENGEEYKWCGSGHWELVENFGIHSSRYDGLRGHCKFHANESAKHSKNAIARTEQGRARIRNQNNKRKSGYILWEHRDEIRAMQIYKNRCGYCGAKINYKTVEYDHIIPISKNGKTVPENMIPSCVTCNRGVGGKKAHDLLPWLYKKFGESIGDCIYEDILRKQAIIENEARERVQDAMMFIE